MFRTSLRSLSLQLHFDDLRYDIWFGNASSGTAATSASSYEMFVLSAYIAVILLSHTCQHDLAFRQRRVSLAVPM